MTRDEALRLAWGALEDIGDEWGFTSQRTVPKRKEAITAIKEALEQPEQEPVAWRYRWSVEGGKWVWNYATYIERQKDDRCEPLYTSPPQRKPLTDEEIWESLGGIDCTRPMLIARAIEAAHGIGGEA